MRESLSLLLVTTVLLLLALIEVAVGLEGRLRAEGGDLALPLTDGRVLRGEALTGLILVVGRGSAAYDIRIDAVDEDKDASGAAVRLYRLSARHRVEHSFEPLCQPDAAARRAGFPLPDGTGGFVFTCTSGAAGKCALMGYRPWIERPGVPMADLHRACIHMLRADYGGDDRPTTRDGTLIDVYDRFGIQKPDNTPGMSFEAAWSAEGAVCVAHPRIVGHVTADELGWRYPHLAGRLGRDTCSEALALSDHRALLFNRSAGPAAGEGR